MFAFAIWDVRSHKLHIARDRAGKKPLFYARTAEGFVFASTLNAVLALHPSKPDVNPLAIDAYLSYQAIPAPLTAFEGVEQLPPAHSLVFNLDQPKLAVERYWDVRYTPKLKLSEAEVLEQMDVL